MESFLSAIRKHRAVGQTVGSGEMGHLPRLPHAGRQPSISRLLYSTMPELDLCLTRLELFSFV